MKTFMLFGYKFSVERFKRYSVQVGFDPERGYAERGRFDSLKVATEFLRDECEVDASYNVTRDVYGIVEDRLTGVQYGPVIFNDGVDMVRRLTVSGSIGRRQF